MPHAYQWIERAGWVDNLRLAAAGELTPHRRRGREFSDSEVFKLAEAMAWEAGRGGPVDLDDLAEITDLVEAAQEPGGYINTMFGRSGQAPRYSTLESGHELYCSGHLIQAGVARLRAGVEDGLTRAAIRVADHVCAEFGATGRQVVCGHPGIEMALVELYRVTFTLRYLEQARLFVERRGRGALADIEFGRAYFQDDVPFRERDAFAGHAVRALYLACGAVDVAVETEDEGLLSATVRQWEHTVAARTFLTGGMGARHEGGSFGEDFELSPDATCAETCAGIASVMLAWRLSLATGRARFADLAERTLYNLVAASTSLDGKAFSCTNPLRQRVAARTPDRCAPSPRADVGGRAPWFAGSCCPTNVARLLASFGGYVASRDGEGVRLHQYVSAEIRTGDTQLEVETGYPWDGSVTVRVNRTGDTPWPLSLRVPAWADRATVVTPDGTEAVSPGYAVVSRRWQVGDEVHLTLPVTPRWTLADPRIDAVRGCVAIERGPIVYCAESVDQETSVELDTATADCSGSIAERPVSLLGQKAIALEISGSTSGVTDVLWPYGAAVRPLDPRQVPLTLIPYHLWSNRGPSTMRVWLPRQRRPPQRQVRDEAPPSAGAGG